MGTWENIITSLITSLIGGSGIAWMFLKLYVKDISRKVINEKLDEKLKNYTTKEDMQIERIKLLDEVERKFLTLAAFREFEKRMEKNFETIESRLHDSAKRFDKLDEGIEHIKDLIIKKLT